VAASHNSTAMPSLWHPLRNRTFRNLLLADVVSDIGTFMQNVGAAWLMVSFNAGPLYIALVQTASALPFFVFVLPAGALGDIVDRRKLILVTEVWMTVIAALLAVLTFGRLASPLLLLALTFALSAGDAVETPAWRAILPELVANEDLAPAAALNGIEFNFARAVGPALAGLLIAMAGVGTAFAINAVSFLGVIFVIARWRRPMSVRRGAAERIGQATIAAIRYVWYSPGVRVVPMRSGTTMFFASGLMALLPSVARNINGSPMTYGALVGCFGAGAVIGAVLMRQLKQHASSEQIVSGAVILFGLNTIAMGLFHNLWVLCLSVFLAGAGWIVFISLFSVLLLTNSPTWMRARVMAVAMLAFFGGVAAGSAVWGAMATKMGLQPALVCSGAGAVFSTALGLFLQLPGDAIDLTPWVHWRAAANEGGDLAASDSGPALVTVEYEVSPEHEEQFLKAMRNYERIRRRDGAYRWGIFRDLEAPMRYVEVFLVASWGEHLRQHDRVTRADQVVVDQVRLLSRKPPTIRHLISPERNS